MSSVVINGDTSGAITLAAPAVAGTNTLTLPATTGTFALTSQIPTITRFKNRIINGDMRIDQRNSGASVTPATPFSQYMLDRWNYTFSVGSKLSIQQNAGSVTPPNGFSNYMGFTSLSAYTVGSAEGFTVRQLIEGFNTADLAWGTANAKTVTLSFWVRSSLTGTFGGYIANSDSTRTYPYSYTVSAANTWEQKTITIVGDTTGTWVGSTNGRGISVGFNLGSGSTLLGTANTWAGAQYNGPTGATSVVGTNGATFYITGVQLEVGSSATGFEYVDYGTQLAMCQRYYETSGTLAGLIVSMYSVGSGYGAFYYKVTKRAVPTVTTAGTGTFTVYNNSATYGVSSFGNTAQINMCSVGVNLSSNVGSGGSASIVGSSDANSLMFSAEL